MPKPPMNMTNLNIIIMIFIILSIFFPSFSLAIDTLTSSTPLTINQTLVSKGEVYELGFINPANNGNLYIAIWYKNVDPKVYVWVANRDKPITSKLSTLSIGKNHNIVLSNETVTGIWSSNQSVSVVNTVAQLLDDGNFVLRPENNDDPENYIWQSFHYPTDTLLPGMKLGWNREAGVNRFLQSWKSYDDPGRGDYRFMMDIDGFPELFLYKEGMGKVFRSGPWNGRTFSGAPRMNFESAVEHEFVDNWKEISYTFKMKNTSVYSRMVLGSLGSLRRSKWVEASLTWSGFWSGDSCDRYTKCGPFGICDAASDPFCKCMKGFQPKNELEWDLKDGKEGCVRSSKLDCRSDGFLALKNMKLPKSNNVFVNKTMNLTECGEICKRNCSCTAYANMDITGTGSGCVIWVVDLLDMRQFDSEGSGQDLYVRVANSDLDTSSAPGSSKSGSSKSNNVVKIVAITVGTCIALILLVVFYFKRKKMQWSKGSKIDKRGPHERSQDFLMNEGNIVLRKKNYFSKATTQELPSFDFTTLAIATNNFSDENKLGQGGFGRVYKGSLTKNEVVVVKRLSRTSGQGIEELRNEVKLIAKLQHKNLVRLLGCCIEVEEKLLVYEYMENKSLNAFLFGKQKSAQLNWQKRFNIISGIARGLLYLHQDSTYRIIHRDIKASNILLDKVMNPKISDFGMARIFGGDQTEAETKKVVGTHGYMAPEYAMDGHFSIKSDVFSFGVLVLEIVTGQRNKGFYYASNQLNLLGHTWRLWNEGNPLELLDASIGGDFSKNEVLRCIHIGLLCVQENAEDRPTMSKVMLMLDSNNDMPEPKYPGFSLERRHSELESSSKQDESMTVNQVTITILDGR